MQKHGYDSSIGTASWWARALGYSAAVGTILALLGPYGSFYNDLALRLLDWVAIMLMGALIFGLLVPPMLRAGGARGMPRPFVVAVAIAVATIPAAMVAAAVTNFFWPEHVAEYRWQHWYLQTLLLAVITVALWSITEVARSVWASDAPRSPDRAENGASGDVICLQMEDHYVRIHRETGSTLELMPLHEAVRRYGRADGLQVHRSWWVAERAIEAAERDVRAWRLTLRNGLVVPVARNRIGDVRRRGWLEPR